MSQRARIVHQRLRNITVEVREAGTSEVRGTGVLISPGGLVATCAHVVDACGVEPRSIGGGAIGVRLPATGQHEAQDRVASVVWFPRNHEDDLVVLQLDGGAVPPERVGVCGPAGPSDDHRFRSFGYRMRGDYIGLLASGVIAGHVPSPRNYWMEPVQLESADLDSGMSGAAVFDTERNLIVGFVFQVWDAGETQKDRDLAFAVDAALLGESPAAELLVATELPPDSAPTADVAVLPTNGPGPGWDISAAPEDLGMFVGRTEALAHLRETWRQCQVRVLALVGMAGQGKTSLVRNWLRSATSADAPESAFWWTFDESTAEVDQFFTALLRHLSKGAMDSAAVPTATAKAHVAAGLLYGARHLVVLDGLDVLQADRGETTGSLTSPALRDFLTYAASGQHRSLCVLTTQLPVRDLDPIRTVETLRLDRLSADEGLDLLRANGITGDDGVLRALVEDWSGHALALVAVAIYLRTKQHGQAERVEELPGSRQGLSFEKRLQTIGNAVQERRDPAERALLGHLALARLPLPAAALLGMVSDTSVEVGHPTALRKSLYDLLRAEAVRPTPAGDLLLHPVLRSLYRARLRLAEPELVKAMHRALAEYYYRQVWPAESK